jgi:hypothetical protein
VFPVEIRITDTDEKAVTVRMNAMREWLDHRRFEPSTFRYRFETCGLVFQVDFKLEAEAVAFAEMFSGRSTPSPEIAVAG